MRVTDEMRRKAVEAIARGYGERHVIDVVLTAALADVPEPTLPYSVAYSGLLRDYRDRQVDIANLHEALAAERHRIAELEAKLAQVRDEIDEPEPMNDADWRRTLRAILDRKEDG